MAEKAVLKTLVNLNVVVTSVWTAKHIINQPPNQTYLKKDSLDLSFWMQRQIIKGSMEKP